MVGMCQWLGAAPPALYRYNVGMRWRLGSTMEDLVEEADNTQWCDDCGKYTVHIQKRTTVRIKGEVLKGDPYTIQCINAHQRDKKKAA